MCCVMYSQICKNDHNSFVSNLILIILVPKVIYCSSVFIWCHQPRRGSWHLSTNIIWAEVNQISPKPKKCEVWENYFIYFKKPLDPKLCGHLKPKSETQSAILFPRNTYWRGVEDDPGITQDVNSEKPWLPKRREYKYWL